MVSVATDLVTAAIANAHSDHAAEVAALEHAVKTQDELQYTEPPYWFYPVRQSLGAAYLRAKRPADAQRVFNEDLAYFKNNGWSLWGLGEAIAAQGKDAGKTREATAGGVAIRRHSCGPGSELMADRRHRALSRLGLSHSCRARRCTARTGDRRARNSDLSDDELRVRRLRRGGRVFQSAGIRQHLFADHESDRRRVRRTHRESRRRRRRALRSRADLPHKPPRCSRCSNPAITSSHRVRCTAARSRS